MKNNPCEDSAKAKQVEEALRTSLENYRYLVKYAPTGIYEIDFSTGKFVHVNDAMCQYLGYTEKELLTSVGAFDILDDESIKLFKERIKKTFAGEKIDENIEYRGKTKDGRIFWTMLNVKLINRDNKPQGALVVAQDITERKKTEEALRSNQNRFQLLSTITSTLLSNSQPRDNLYKICLETMKFLDCDVFFNFLADKQKEMLHLNAYFGVPSETAKTFEWLSFGEAVCGCAAQAGERIVCENIPDAQDHRTELVSSFGVKAYCANPIFSDGKVIGTLSFGSKKKRFFSEEELSLMKTVTSQVSVAMSRREAEEALKQRTEQLEQTQDKLKQNALQLEKYASQMERLAQERANQLKEAERMVAIGQTAGMVGHDIRNPLQAITSDLFLAKSELLALADSNEKKYAIESMDEIQKNVDYINKIVGDLQDYSRVIKPEKVDFNFSELLSSVVLPIGIPQNIAYTVDVEPSLDFKTDTTLLRRILTNLITNAIQAMPDGGTLTVSGCTCEDSVLVIVEDTGVGIPDDVKPKLFTPMMTTKSKGQGLGLAVVKRLVEALNGTIIVESEEGKGTKFIIELPITN